MNFLCQYTLRVSALSGSSAHSVSTRFPAEAVPVVKVFALTSKSVPSVEEDAMPYGVSPCMQSEEDVMPHGVSPCMQTIRGGCNATRSFTLYADSQRRM